MLWREKELNPKSPPPDFRIGTPLLEFWLELLFARQAKKQ